MLRSGLYNGLTESQSHALSLDFLRDPDGIECIVNFAHRTTYQQEDVAGKLKKLADADTMLAQETAGYRALFTTVGTMLGDSVFKEVAAGGGMPVYSDNGETYYTRVIRAAHTAGGLRLRDVKAEHAAVQEVCMQEAAMLTSGLCSFFTQAMSSSKDRVQVLGHQWQFRPDYLVDNTGGVPIIHGSVGHLLDYRKHINGGNTPRINQKVNAAFATANHVRSVLGVLALVQQF